MDIRPLMPGAPPLTPAPNKAPPPGLDQESLHQESLGAFKAESSAKLEEDSSAKGNELQDAFTDFVGQTLFGSMLASMRKTVGKPAYMHGGRTKEVFQKQLDQIMVEHLTEASVLEIAQPMFELLQMQRRG